MSPREDGEQFSASAGLGFSATAGLRDGGRPDFHVSAYLRDGGRGRVVQRLPGPAAQYGMQELHISRCGCHPQGMVRRCWVPSQRRIGPIRGPLTTATVTRNGRRRIRIHISCCCWSKNDGVARRCATGWGHNCYRRLRRQGNHGRNSPEDARLVASHAAITWEVARVQDPIRGVPPAASS